MNIIDNDLLSIQEARILVENADRAREQLADFSQERLDVIVEEMLDAISDHIRELAILSHEETGYGILADKIVKNQFVCQKVRNDIRDMRCVGFIEEDHEKGVMKVGVPLGVIAALLPSTSPVSTAIFNAVIAVKAGNAIVFSPHPRAKNCIGRTLDLMAEAAKRAGAPEGTISYLHTISDDGTKEILHHSFVNLILDTGVPAFLETIRHTGKSFIYGGSGNGPAFIERTADVGQAVRNIFESKTFDNGMVSTAEQSVVVERCIEENVRKEMIRQGAYFMSEEEAEKLAHLIYKQDGSLNPEFVGLSAKRLAARAGFDPGQYVQVLIAEGKYALSDNPYSRERLCPVLAYYIEDDWRDACEKCIELLLFKNDGHTLVIHSTDEYVIRQFALKKPVARVLVNTPATLGSMGMTTNLFPSMTLGGRGTENGITSDNISPMNLVYIRTLSFGVRSSAYIRDKADQEYIEPLVQQENGRQDRLRLLQQILDKALDKHLNDT